jgi:Lrp/AsnC family transcriptional regulator, regulator for asnA, asnC and gidA
MWYERLALRVTRPGHYSNAQSAARGPVASPRRLDDIDRALIEALQQNGRDSFRRIASEVGVSEATIRSRYQRLCEEGTIQVTAVTNPLGLGFDAMAMVGVRTSGPPEDAAEQIARLEEADYVVVAAGQFDLLVELVCVDRRHLLDVTNRIRALDGVSSTETFIYLELRKQLYDWGIRKTPNEPPAVAGAGKGG